MEKKKKDLKKKNSSDNSEKNSTCLLRSEFLCRNKEYHEVYGKLE